MAAPDTDTVTVTVTACVLIIGNEVLSGRTQDVNLKYLGRNLNAIGIRLAEARIIADDEATIVGTLNEWGLYINVDRPRPDLPFFLPATFTQSPLCRASC